MVRLHHAKIEAERQYSNPREYLIAYRKRRIAEVDRKILHLEKQLHIHLNTAMKAAKTAQDIDARTLDGLLDDLREVEKRLGVALRNLDSAARFSEEYHDAHVEIYTLMTWMEGLSRDIQTEMERFDDQLPDD